MKKIAENFEIQSLGKSKIPSPLTVGYFKSDDERVLCDINIGLRKELPSRPLKSMSLEVAGPREMIYFEPQKVKAAVVSCGGLCPGINDVIRALVMELHFRYGVRNIIGVKYASIICAGSFVSYSTPAPSIVAGTAVAENATTGTPLWKASTIGTQNPSCSLAQTNTSAMS